jgi:hypothetical protein
MKTESGRSGSVVIPADIGEMCRPGPVSEIRQSPPRRYRSPQNEIDKRERAWQRTQQKQAKKPICMHKPKYWRVMVKRGRKAHLTPFVASQGSGNIALCGQALPDDARKGPSTTISDPFGNECDGCLRKLGLLKKPPLSKEQRRIDVAMKLHRHLRDVLGLTDSEIRDSMAAAEIEAKRLLALRMDSSN